MSQQINLYQPMFRAQRKVFSAMTIAQVAGVFIVGLLLIYGYGRVQVGALESQIVTLEEQRNTAMQQLQRLSARTQPAQRSRLIDEQLREGQTELDAKLRMLRAFQTRRFGNTDGFSLHFAGLARQRIDGLWLTRIDIRDDGISFAGEAEAAELLPRYIARLGRERPFTGTEFQRLQLTRGDEPGTPVRFSVSTAANEATP